MGKRRAAIRTFRSKFYLSFSPVLSPVSGGSYMMQPASAPFSALFSYLTQGSAVAVVEPLVSMGIREEPEETYVYVSDNLDLIVRNYGLAPLEEDFPSEAVYALGDFFEHLTASPTMGVGNDDS